MKSIIVLSSIFIITASAFAADDLELGEVVVTATRTEEAVENIPSSVTVITAEEIERKQATTVLEILRTVPALDVVQNGGPGQTTSIFIRGANSAHTLVMIDGVEANDPVTPSRSFNFADLTVDNIERIEIIRGPQSPLYGSDAIAGVINIITKKGKGKTRFTVSAETGSYSSSRGAVSVSGSNDRFHYSISASRVDTDGISAASKDDGNSEDDGYKNTTLSAKVGIKASETFEADLIVRRSDAEAELDNSGGAGGDDPNYTSETDMLFWRAEARLYLYEGLWEQKLALSKTDHDRETDNGTDAAHPLDLERSSYNSEITKIEWQHNLYLNENNTMTIGVESQKEKAESNYYSESMFGPYASTFSEKEAKTNGYYLQEQFKSGGFYLVAGIRSDDHDEFGSETTYRIAPAYMIESTGTKIKATYGTGFKAPSLYQLYDPSSGNINLDPEESSSWDIGIEQALFGDKLLVGITYFDNDYDDLISWSGTYQNVDKAESKGYELTMSLKPMSDFQVNANYTHTSTEDESTGEELLRRPKNKYSLNANYRFMEKGTLNLSVLHIGTRDDVYYVGWIPTRTELDSYTRADLAASYSITKNINIFGRIENLNDSEYEEVKGYGTAGRSYYAGVKATF